MDRYYVQVLERRSVVTVTANDASDHVRRPAIDLNSIFKLAAHFLVPTNVPNTIHHLINPLRHPH